MGFFGGVWIYFFFSSRSYLDHRLRLQPLAAALSVPPSPLQLLPCSPAPSSPPPMPAPQKTSPCPVAPMLSLVRWQPQQDGKHGQVITQLFSARLDRKRIARPSFRELLAFAAESSGSRHDPIPALTASCALCHLGDKPSLALPACKNENHPLPQPQSWCRVSWSD